MVVVMVAGLSIAQATTIPWSQPSSAVSEIVDGRVVVRPVPGDMHVLLKVREPAPPSNRFVIKSTASGRVAGRALLEMLVLFANGPAITIKTLDTGGPMAYLSGKFEERSIELPFVADPANPPVQITIIVVSEGEATISFAPFTIEPWPRWSLTWMAAGGFAALLGVVVGVLGGIYGLLAAIPSSRKVASLFGKIGVALGFAMVIAAPCLYAGSLPFGIWLPTLIAGVVAIIAFGGTLPLVRKGIESAERMRAEADPSLEPT